MGGQDQPTAFQESNALLLLQDDDVDGALKILETMLPGELRRLELAAGRLAQLASQVRRYHPSRIQGAD